LALQNEGSADAFATCGGIGNDTGYRTITEVSVRLVNQNENAGPVTVSCTMVVGFGGGSPPIYSTKSVSLVFGLTNSLVWVPADFGFPYIPWPQVSCQLPPGTGIHYMRTEYNINVGA